jgi:organic radical activating enzyme
VQATLNNNKSNLVEIFSSVQGEGSLVGLRQAFLRFHGCNLDCAYCDTAAALNSKIPDFCSVERTPGRRDFVNVPNPVAIDYVLNVIDNWQRGWPGVHHSISLTGGEPLLQVKALKEWLPELRSILPVYLETNGILHDALREIIDLLDFIGMDIKLPSTSGQSGLWNDHLLFMQIAARKNVFVKIVIDKETQDWEIIKACEIISSVDRKIPLILQPRTLNDGKIDIKPIQMLEFQEIAGNFLDESRIIPQTHIFLGFL